MLINNKTWQGFKGKLAALIMLSLMLVFCLPMFNQVLAAESANILVEKPGLQVESSGFMAGYSVPLKVAAPKGSKVIFEVLKPDGGVIKLNSRPGSAQNSFQAMVPKKDTIVAGQYYVGARLEGQKRSFSTTSFKVYSLPIDLNKSTVKVDRYITQVSKGAAFLTVNIQDKHGNPLAGHELKVVSSRQADKIEYLQGQVTNASGDVKVKISSAQRGAATFMVYDLTANEVLPQRPELAFVNSADSRRLAIGGDDFLGLVPVAKAQSIAGGPVSKLTITDLKDPIKVAENVSFTVKALDADDNVSENYAGKIHFSVKQAAASDVVLPEDYQFTGDDLGVHSFALGLSFKTAGKYTLVATDLGDFTVVGEKEINVISGVAANDSSGSSTSTGKSIGSAAVPKISAPKPGTYNKSVLDLVGVAEPGIALKIFVNNAEIGGVDADKNGNFTFKVDRLKDGKNEIKIVSLDKDNNSKATSDTLVITVDTVAPTANNLKFDPKGPVEPESLVKVTLDSENNLAQVAMILNDALVLLTEDLGSPGTYRGSLKAPKEIGSYSADLILVDALGNETRLKDKKQLVVAKKAATSPDGSKSNNSLGSGSDTLDGKPTETGASTIQVIPAVSELKAFSGNQRINLEWKAVENANIEKYRIFYGLRADSLINAVDTFDAKTKWYVPELENGKTYFFALVAVDSEGRESAIRSEIVNATPFEVSDTGLAEDRSPASLFGFGKDANNVVSPSEENLHAAAVSSRDLEKSGPEVWAILFFSMASAILWMQKKRRV